MYLMYLRKSRADENGATVEEVLAKHEAMLQEYCVKNFDAPLDERYIYREVVSGETISDRPQLQKILELVANNNVDGVLVIEPQRLSRGDLVDCGIICRVFKYSGTKIITPQKTFDLTDKYDEKFLTMTLQQGNDYLEYIKTIMERGRIAAVKGGQYIGSAAPYGYDKVVVDGKKTLQLNDKAAVVKLIFELYLGGKSEYQIARELDRQGLRPMRSEEWCKTSVRHILTNVTYTGKVKFGERVTTMYVDEQGRVHKQRKKGDDEIIADALHPAIISESDYQRAQELVGTTPRTPRKKELINPFATLVKCGVCGYSVALQASQKKCAPRMVCTHQARCHNKSILYSEFVGEVIKALKSAISDFSVNVADCSTNTENVQIAALRNDLTALERKQLKLYEFLEDGTYSKDVFAERNAKLATERQRLETALDEAEKKEAAQRRIDDFKCSFYEAIDELQDTSVPAELQNRLLKSILSKIEYTRTDTEPHISLYF